MLIAEEVVGALFVSVYNGVARLTVCQVRYGDILGHPGSQSAKSIQ